MLGGSSVLGVVTLNTTPPIVGTYFDASIKAIKEECVLV